MPRVRGLTLDFLKELCHTLDSNQAETVALHSDIERLRDIICHDLDPDFVETLSIQIAWEYYELFRRLQKETDLADDYRQEEFARQRGCVVVFAMLRAARKHRVPFEFIRLECNGQNKLALKAGRVILIQESVRTLEDVPKVADYKVEMAELHGLVRQLELDLGDRPHHTRDWSGCVLGVLLHGPAGHKFTQRHKILGSLMIGVTDAAYRQWLIRIDLHHLAMYGRGGLPTTRVDDGTQPDNVNVTRKRKNTRREDEA